MACYIFGAGDFDGLEERPGAEDYVIAADGGYTACRRAGVEPQLLLGDFDSLAEVPALPHVERVPVEKDDTDMMLAIKRGLERGETLFHLYGGMGGQRTDHTLSLIHIWWIRTVPSTARCTAIPSGAPRSPITCASTPRRST